MYLKSDKALSLPLQLNEYIFFKNPTHKTGFLEIILSEPIIKTDIYCKIRFPNSPRCTRKKGYLATVLKYLFQESTTCVTQREILDNAF